MTQNNQTEKKILITWRLMINQIHNYKKLFKKENISYDLLHVKQYATTSDLIKIISKYDGLICGDDQLDKKVLSKANPEAYRKLMIAMQQAGIETTAQSTGMFESPNQKMLGGM